MKRSMVALCGVLWLLGYSAATCPSFAGPYHSSAQAKFGNSSIFFDGAGYLQLANSSDWNFGSGDFTIDFWVYSTHTDPLRFMVFGYDPPGEHYGDFSVSWGFQGNIEPPHYGSGFEFWGRRSDLTSYTYKSGSGDLPTTQWIHVAAARAGSQFRIFQNGHIVLSSNMDFTIKDNATMPLQEGTMTSNGGFFYLSGAYIEEMRISKGIARWTSDFAPPTTAYSGSDGIDQYTELLIQSEAVNGSAIFLDTSWSAHDISVATSFNPYSPPIPESPINPVPEPATMLLVASGLAGLAGLRKSFSDR